MKREKGSLIIEGMVSLTILLISGFLVLTIGVQVKKSKKVRDETRILNNLAYSIIQELKYNYSLKEVDEMIGEECLNIEYSEGLIKELIYKDLGELDKGNGIVIKKSGEDSNNLYLKVVINGNLEDSFVEKEFVKEFWQGEKE